VLDKAPVGKTAPAGVTPALTPGMNVRFAAPPGPEPANNDAKLAPNLDNADRPDAVVALGGPELGVGVDCGADAKGGSDTPDTDKFAAVAAGSVKPAIPPAPVKFHKSGVATLSFAPVEESSSNGDPGETSTTDDDPLKPVAVSVIPV
jgi:hypothetical protein